MYKVIISYNICHRRHLFLLWIDKIFLIFIKILVHKRNTCALWSVDNPRLTMVLIINHSVFLYYFCNLRHRFDLPASVSLSMTHLKSSYTCYNIQQLNVFMVISNLMLDNWSKPNIKYVITIKPKRWQKSTPRTY